MRCGRVRLTLFFPLHNSNFLYQIENVVCYPFRTANLVDNGTKEGQIGEGCLCNVLETRKRSGNAGFLGFAQIAQGGRLPIIHLKLPKPHSRALPFFEPRFDQLESFIKAFRNFIKTCSLQMDGIGSFS